MAVYRKCALAFLVVSLSGCFASSPSSQADPPLGEDGQESTADRSDVPTRDTSGPGGRPRELLSLGWTNVSHSSFILNYTVKADPVAVTIAYGTTPELAEERAAPSEFGRREVRLGFLQANTTYYWELRATAASLRDHVSGFFTTGENPYHWATSTIHVQPGMDINGCTAAFVLQSWDNETVYLTTAGHCVSGVGSRVSGPAGAVGTVVSFENGGTGRDYALVQIDPEERAFTSPQMIHFTGPVGLGTTGTIRVDDKACHHGYGIVLGDLQQTRARCGDFGGHGGADTYGQTFWFYGHGVSGDSGSAVLDHRTGEAIGILTHLGVGAGTVNTGTPLVHMIEHVALQGFDVGLSTAPYVPQSVPPI